MSALVLHVREIGEGETSAPMPETNARKKITDRHHLAARLLAGGSAPSEVAAVTGYSNVTVSILQVDPAFAELVEFYRSKIAEKFDVFGQRLSAIGLATQAEILDRLETEPASFTPKELTQLMTVSADRTGFGPSAKQTVNINVSMADRLRAARARVIEGDVIDG